MKVLIIDDEEDIRAIAGMSLTLLGGLEVVEADNGEDGIKKARKDKPDVILLDMTMPGMDGPTTLSELKSDAETKHIPVIFLTAKAMASELQRIKQLGAIGVLSKPFDPTNLTSQMKEVLEAQSKGISIS